MGEGLLKGGVAGGVGPPRGADRVSAATVPAHAVLARDSAWAARAAATLVLAPSAPSSAAAGVTVGGVGREGREVPARQLHRRSRTPI